MLNISIIYLLLVAWFGLRTRFCYCYGLSLNSIVEMSRANMWVQVYRTFHSIPMFRHKQISPHLLRFMIYAFHKYKTTPICNCNKIWHNEQKWGGAKRRYIRIIAKSPWGVLLYNANCTCRCMVIVRVMRRNLSRHCNWSFLSC